MRLVGIMLLTAVGGMVLAGCGSSNSSPGFIVPVSDRVLVTPQGTPGFVTVGSTDVQVSFPGGAVTVPTTFTIGKLQGEADLIAPLPLGRVFVGGLNFFGAALNTGFPVQFSVPVGLTVPTGTGLQVFMADPNIVPIQFRTVLDANGNAVFTQVINGRIPFATQLLGQFAFVTVP